MFGRKAVVSLATAAIALLVVVPGTAQAAGGVNARLDASGVLTITGDNDVDRMALVTVTPPGGSPDLVVGDVTAGIASISPNCFMVDPTIFRCPQSMVDRIVINLGAGNDSLSAQGISGLVDRLNQAYLRAYMGRGNDVALGAPAPNVIFGGSGRDLLMGGPFPDQLIGGPQNDFLVGLGGNDLIQCNGGPGRPFNHWPREGRGKR